MIEVPRNFLNLLLLALGALALWIFFDLTYRQWLNRRVFFSLDQLGEMVRLAAKGKGTPTDSKKLSDLHTSLEYLLRKPLFGWGSVVARTADFLILKRDTSAYHQLTHLAEIVKIVGEEMEGRNNFELAIKHYNLTIGQTEKERIAYDFSGRLLQALILSIQELKKNPSMQEIAQFITDLYMYQRQLNGQAPDRTVLNDMIDQGLVQTGVHQYGLKLV